MGAAGRRRQDDLKSTNAATGRSSESAHRVMKCANNNEMSSFHPQEANFLYGDASVELLFEGIDPDVLVTMITAKAND
jgi:hypothetical protein